MIDDKRTLQLLKRKRAVIAARDDLIAFTQLMMPDPNHDEDVEHSLYKPQRFHRVIGAALEEVERGDYRRLMINVGPRMGKTTLASAMFPAWYIGRHPERSIIVATYNEHYSWDLGRRVRDIMETPQYKQVFPGVEIKIGANAVNRVQTTRDGVVFSVGRGSSITGRGGHCLVGDTAVETTTGPKPIRDIVPGDRVLSYDVDADRAVWALTQAVAHRPPARVFRLTTAAGRVVEATSDHRFYTHRGWVECRSLAPGDTLLRSVRNNVCAQRGRGEETSAPRAGGVLLFRDLRLPRAQFEAVWRAGVRALRRAGTAAQCLWDTKGRPDLLFAGVSGSGSSGGIAASRSVAAETMRTMQRHVRAAQQEQPFLFGAVQERSALETYERQQKQPALEGRRGRAAINRSQSEEFSRDPAFGTEARQQSVSALRGDDRAGRASHQRGEYRQQGREPGDVMSVVPQQTAFFGIEDDAVVSVEDTHRDEDVFDIQVAGTNCFFANGVLVHNCVLLDDPIKDRTEADSVLVREKLWTWYNQVLRTRLMDSTGSIVLISTRWSEDDLAGRLVDPMNPYFNVDEAKAWRKIDLPALAEADDILGRAEGEPLWPERFTKQYLEDIRATDPRGFAALYQGRPSPKEGAFFRSEDLVAYNKMDDVPAFHKLRFYGASDHAVSTDRVADKTCLMIVGVDEKDNIWIMPDVVWAKLDSHAAVEGMIALMKKYKPQFWWAEGGAITKSLGPFLRKRMIEKQVFCAIDPINPAADKQQRAQAIQARTTMKMVHFPAFTRWWSDAQDQILKFPHGAKDDLVDALALIGLGLSKMHGRTRNKPVEPEVKSGTFRELFMQTRRREGRDRRSRSLQGW